MGNLACRDGKLNVVRWLIQRAALNIEARCGENFPVLTLATLREGTRILAKNLYNIFETFRQNHLKVTENDLF